MINRMAVNRSMAPSSREGSASHIQLHVDGDSTILLQPASQPVNSDGLRLLRDSEEDLAPAADARAIKRGRHDLDHDHVPRVVVLLWTTTRSPIQIIQGHTQRAISPDGEEHC